MLPRGSATFSGTNFFSVGPPAAGNGDLGVLGAILGVGHSEMGPNGPKPLFLAGGDLTQKKNPEKVAENHPRVTIPHGMH